MSKKTSGGLVYSTEHGTMCPTCRQPQAACSCKAVLPSGDGIARVGRELRKGKAVIVVKGLILDSAALSALGKQLKTLCGTGGTVKDGQIEIQGEHRDSIINELNRQGFKTKRAGG
ncbi:translation initiation factor Sui1 [Deefgea sp. CFH1-16]|uniref:translation initiation factor Sui1 n=1 Tax=Deefgea sp. CFH1-16 TaxID=2675457 RepID=UPI0015F70944|nr:translation initiation factor Sui1 [Deefgea sp. CFH1-16]MBM5574408.1 translation initiation factor Sui1 [Deefgea sp. CFH1-16]